MYLKLCFSRLSWLLSVVVLSVPPTVLCDWLHPTSINTQSVHTGCGCPHTHTPDALYVVVSGILSVYPLWLELCGASLHAVHLWFGAVPPLSLSTLVYTT